MLEIEKLSFDIPEIEKLVGYTFDNPDYLFLAFTHSSYVNENQEVTQTSNERLEFLGDAVLGLIVADYLYKTLPSNSEGDLSQLRSHLIESASCAKYIHKLQLETYLLMGKGEKKNFVCQPNTSISADLFEALVGAIYLDGGIEAARSFVFSHFKDEIDQILKHPIRNWKAELQDYTQKKYQKIPIYKVTEEVGPDHNKTFQISVFIDDMILGSGYGSSKKSAQQAAACEALEKLNPSENTDL
jgi:ribonuclease-3